MTAPSCPACGRPLVDHDRHIRFGVPDPVLAVEGWEATEGLWLTEQNPRDAVMMQVPNIGAFVRALVPIRLEEGFHVTYGVWVGVAPSELQRAFALWWTPDYSGLQLQGRLANAIPPWGNLGAPVDLEVRDTEHTPYCASSSDPDLQQVLSRVWPHETVLPHLPHYRPMPDH